jgi:hypothetical protein
MCFYLLLFSADVVIFVFYLHMEPFLSQYIQKWVEQYLELSQQRQHIDETLRSLKALITTNGGTLPGAEAAIFKPETKSLAPAITKAYADYDTKGSWAYKIEYVLAANDGPPIPVIDIATTLNTIEPELDINKIIKAVTMEASKLGLNGKLGIKKKGNKNFYFLPKQEAAEQGKIGFHEE